MRLVQKKRVIPKWKIEEVENLSELIKKYPVIAVSDITGTPTNLIQKIKRRLKEQYGENIELRVAKNNLFRIAAEKSGLKGRDKLDPLLTGQRLFIFSKLNPFKLYSILEKTRIPAPAKPGMVADKEIIIPAGDTGLQPGPILSAFGKLRIQTRVQGGTIWIAKNTKVAKPGDVISSDLAAMLQRLGIYPVELGIKINAALDNGVFIPEENLKLNYEDYKKQLATAFQNALAVGTEAAVPIPEVIERSIGKAHINAIAVAAEAGIIVPEYADIIIGRAVQKAYAVVAALGEKAKEIGLEAPVITTAPAPQEKPAEEEKKEEAEEEEEEEKKELSEEELASGLGALFG